MRVKITYYAISWKIELSGLKKHFQMYVDHRGLTRFFGIEYYANFAVVRSNHTSFVYIVFYSGHVNCMGISTRTKINDAIRLFKAAFQVGSVSYRVRAIAATGDTTILFTPNSVQQLKQACLLYTSPSPRDKRQSRMPSSA